MSQLPLAGIKVIDLTTVIMGPYAAQWLADLGAEVIKVETPLGDSTRFTGPSVESGMSSLFLGANRNKKAVVIDIKKPDGRDALLHLIGQADVFMHNMRPQKLGAVGLDPDTLRKKHPRLVYAGLHGFGQDGPYGGRPAYDDIIQGMAGNVAMMAQQGGVPRYFPTLTADKTSGLTVALNILAALVKQKATGEGAFVEIPMFESMVAFNLVEHLFGEHFEPPQGAPGYTRLMAGSRLPRKTLDGQICLMPYTDEHWARFFAATGRPELAVDIARPVRLHGMDARREVDLGMGLRDRLGLPGGLDGRADRDDHIFGRACGQVDRLEREARLGQEILRLIAIAELAPRADKGRMGRLNRGFGILGPARTRAHAPKSLGGGTHRVPPPASWSAAPTDQTETGTLIQPRTVLVWRRTAASWSTFQFGKRSRTASRAMRPSMRASAAPRQKWMP